MKTKPYHSEVLNRKDKLRREGHFIYHEELCVGKDGIERVYGYALDGAVYMLNVGYVVEKLKRLEKLERMEDELE